MAHTYFLAPTGPGVGLTSVCLGVTRALDQVGVRVGFCKPISQIPPLQSGGPERSTAIINRIMGATPAEPLALEYAQQKVEQGLVDQLMEEVIQVYQNSAENYDVMIVEGLAPTAQDNYISRLNIQMSRALNSDVILVASQQNYNDEQLNLRIRRAANIFGGLDRANLIGVIINKIGAPPGPNKPFQIEQDEEVVEDVASHDQTIKSLFALPVFKEPNFRCLGLLPWDQNFTAPRLIDIHRYLKTKIISEGEIESRRVTSVAICARLARHLTEVIQPGALLVMPGDRDDVFMAASMAAMNGTPIAGILLTGSMLPHEKIMDLCAPAIATGLPIIITTKHTFQASLLLDQMDIEVPVDDIQRIEGVMDSVAQGIDSLWLRDHAQVEHERRLSPAAFRYSLVREARSAGKRILLPEGAEPRTVKAAIYCQQKGIASCVLLASPEDFYRVAKVQNLEIPEGIEIIDPKKIAHKYIEPMVKLRKHKGLTEPMAEALLEDPVVVGTMMLALNEVDGLVSGAVNTTANTVRPAMQLIKSKPSAKLISSVFFMCLPEQVLVYGDCAINPEPNAEELADIALQSAESAAAFGIEPRVAMISYSTGVSGSGSDVDKVREATRIAKEKKPDLLIDGPLQYDAAFDATVAKQKAPDSPVAGRATVFVFPDLNTGNTTYKAVQRSASVVSIGPMLQGLNKPVNDLSRGASVEDIVYTIALTAIQAQKIK